ncbi:uncharacterized protein VP01_11830g1 [Puccinia sorghi]|uniref:Uncharacterized protein n=1 Tax=Puccinia sorghi TaxID=27349 RepID=A0A0L6VR80_9BASI|nr:uncharacterized protein VP01_11830g1 [Puccinia sorghi]
MSVAGLLDRSSFRAPTVDKSAEQLVPNCFPWDAFSGEYLADVGEFQADHLTSEAMGLDVMSEEMVRKSGAIANAPALNNHPPPGDSSSAAGPSSERLRITGLSGGEVPMSD